MERRCVAGLDPRYVLAASAHPDGALVLDDTQAVKKGRMSVGVAPQHCGATGQTENCQCMVMLTYASVLGHAFIDRELYLPECWTADRARCAAAVVPAERGLVIKPHLGIAMLQRALADPALAFGWVVADSGYGRDPKLCAFCHRRTLAYVFAVPVGLPLVDVRGTASRPDVVLAATRDGDWERRSCGHGGHVTPDGVEDPAAGLPCPDGGETGSDPVDLAEGVVVDWREPELREPARGSRAHVSKAVPAVHDHRPGPVENR